MQETMEKLVRQRRENTDKLTNQRETIRWVKTQEDEAGWTNQGDHKGKRVTESRTDMMHEQKKLKPKTISSSKAQHNDSFSI